MLIVQVINNPKIKVLGKMKLNIWFSKIRIKTFLQNEKKYQFKRKERVMEVFKMNHLYKIIVCQSNQSLFIRNI